MSDQPESKQVSDSDLATRVANLYPGSLADGKPTEIGHAVYTGARNGITNERIRCAGILDDLIARARNTVQDASDAIELATDPEDAARLAIALGLAEAGLASFEIAAARITEEPGACAACGGSKQVQSRLMRWRKVPCPKCSVPAERKESDA